MPKSSSSTRIVFLRHAPTGDNLAGRLQGSRDTPLGDAGKQQAKAVAQRLLTHFGDNLLVYSSPLLRTTETAAEIINELGLTAEITVDARLQQRSYGSWEGKTESELQEENPEQFFRRQSGLDPEVSGFETSLSVSRRMQDFLSDTLSTVNQPQSVPPVLLIVSHGGVIRTVINDLLTGNSSWQGLGKIRHAHWSELKKLDSGQWQLVSHNQN